jgi:hypothetical protein
MPTTFYKDLGYDSMCGQGYYMSKEAVICEYEAMVK